jgi:hypothetical protein
VPLLGMRRAFYSGSSDFHSSPAGMDKRDYRPRKSAW